MIRNNFFFRSFLLLALIATVSCVSDAVQKRSNASFEKKFSQEVSRINSTRLPPMPGEEDSIAPNVARSQQNNDKFASPSEMLGISGSTQYSSAKVDTTKFSLRQEEDFSPDGQILAKARSAGQKLPEDMFDLTYNLELNPPFVVSGFEFDVIAIPQRDYYGVASTLNDKSYLLAGNKPLQKNIDDLIKSQSAEDVEFSEILIKEQKQLKKQQRLAKIFGEESKFVEAEKIKGGNYVEKEEKTPQPEDPMKKAIALQVIKQNFAHNNPVPNQNKNTAVAQNNAAARKTQ